MSPDRKVYRWFYDNIHSQYYDLLMKWCYMPLGGERRCRDDMILGIEFSEKDKILDMCYRTGGATFSIARRTSTNCEIVGMDISIGQVKRAMNKKQYDNVSFIQRDVLETGFDDFHFDKVFITHALHEMPRNI